MRRLLSLALCLPLALAGCGYNFPGQASSLPGGGTRLAIRPFVNQTRDAGVEANFREALESEVERRANFSVVPEQDADVVLAGVLQALRYRPIAFSASDEAMQYETVLVLSASLQSPDDGRVFWQVSNFTGSDSFGAVQGTVVVQSSQFQEQSTLNEQNLARLTDVQLSESQKGETTQRLLENVARDLYNSMVEDF